MPPKDSPRALGAAAAPDGLDERFAGVKGVRLRYFIGGGAGEPLVLLHGLGGAASNWRALAPRLGARHRLLIPDLPGHGGSSPLPATPSLELLADRIGLLSEREGLLPAVVVGHSLGALVALRLARRRPDDVRGVVLAGAAGISSAGARARYALAVTTAVKPGRRLARFRHAIAARPRLRRLVLAWGAADTDALPPWVVESFLVGPALHTDTDSAAVALVADDVRCDLGEVRCPCLVLWGGVDTQTRIQDAFEFARRLRAPVRVLADCGHLLIGERPEACALAVEDFVRALPVRPGSGAR